MSRRARLFVLVALYAGQFLATGLLFMLPMVLRQRGASLEQVGVISLVNFAMIVKLLWAPLVDRYGSARIGHYRSWLLATQPLIAVGLLALAPLDVIGDFSVLLVMAIALAALIATQDIATDALAVRLIDPDHRGQANAIQVGAGFFGSIVGTSGSLAVYQHFGWGWSVTALAVLSLCPMLAIVALKDLADLRTSRQRLSVKTVVSLLPKPGVGVWMGAIVPLVWGGVMLPQALIGPMLVDHGWPLDKLGMLTAVLGGVAGIGGASTVGRLVARLGRTRVLSASIATQLLATVGLLPLTVYGSGAVAVLTIAVLGIARGVVNTIIFTISMDLCRPETAGSDFTFLASWGYAVAIAAGAAGPAIAGTAGYATAIALALVTSASGLVCVRFFFVDRSTSPQTQATFNSNPAR